jgi:predicted lipoprotein with Yx(FWY)xxD motif
MRQRAPGFRACMVFAATLVLATAAPAAPEGVTEYSTEAAIYYRAPGERSLYFNDREASRGEILCIDACLEFWIPFEAAVYPSIDPPWSVIRRPDERLQWAFEGKPLYTYRRDSFPGARTGEGAGRGVWMLLKEFQPVPPGMQIQETLLGYVLADNGGHTLYAREGAVVQESAEYDGRLWQRFAAPWLANDQGEWTVHAPAAGVRQWAYQGQPLFTYAKDNEPGDVYGQGVDGDWSAVVLEPAAGLPPWLTVQWTDLGLAYADAEGMTLYAPIDIDVINAAQTCPEECMAENWRPVLAAAGEESTGFWIIRDNDEGQRQWSYKGKLVYTHKRDEVPGDMKGHGIAVGYRIGEGWRIIPVQSGIRRDRD